MSYALAIGCSNTDATWGYPYWDDSRKKIWPKWPELLGNKLRKKVRNVAASGMSNHAQFLRAIHIIASDDPPDEVWWMMTYSTRVSVLGIDVDVTMITNNLESYHDMVARGADHCRNGLPKERYNFIHQGTWPKKIALSDVVKKHATLPAITTSDLSDLFSLQEICKARKIKLMVTALYPMFFEYNTRMFDDRSFKKNHVEYENYINSHHMMKYIDQKNIIHGVNKKSIVECWLEEKAMGPREEIEQHYDYYWNSVSHLILPNDGHPTALGQQKIAEMLYCAF